MEHPEWPWQSPVGDLRDRDPGSPEGVLVVGTL